MYYIVYNSITYANRVKSMLENTKGFAGVVHTPKKIAFGGCSYSLKTNEDKFRLAVRLSRELGIKIKGAYKELDNGEFTEVVI